MFLYIYFKFIIYKKQTHKQNISLNSLTHKQKQTKKKGRKQTEN